MTATTLEEVYQDLLARAPENKMEPRMEPMYRMMELLGEPQKSAPVIHITGTNGKTTTARIIESVLSAHGLRTGRYTSPHLVKVSERIVVDGEPVDDATFVRVWNEILPLVQLCDAELEASGQNRLTYFEAVTVLGFAIFADAPVDVMVLEVGLGGITDATNVANAQVSVVTPISVDHADLLGDTPAEIAVEKSGIIKPYGFLISAAQEPEAAQVLFEKANEVAASTRFENVEFAVTERSMAVGGQQITVQGLAHTYADLFLPLHGPHQAENLAVAIAAIEAFLGEGTQSLNQEILQEGLTAVTSPGRMEVLRTSPTLIVDAAHNPAGIEVTAATLKETFNFSSLGLVVGILSDKDAYGILAALFDAFGDEVQYLALTQSDSPRAIPAQELEEDALDAGWDEETIFVTPAVTDAIKWVVDNTREDDANIQDEGKSLIAGTGGAGVLVTGSITLVGQVRGMLGTEIDQAEAPVIVDDHDDLADFFAAEDLDEQDE